MHTCRNHTEQRAFEFARAWISTAMEGLPRFSQLTFP
jgi:hypothetical protein